MSAEMRASAIHNMTMSGTTFGIVFATGAHATQFASTWRPSCTSRLGQVARSSSAPALRRTTRRGVCRARLTMGSTRGFCVPRTLAQAGHERSSRSRFSQASSRGLVRGSESVSDDGGLDAQDDMRGFAMQLVAWDGADRSEVGSRAAPLAWAALAVCAVSVVGAPAAVSMSTYVMLEVACEEDGMCGIGGTGVGSGLLASFLGGCMGGTVSG